MATMARFNSPDQVETWAKTHGVQSLRGLIGDGGLDPLSRHFAQTWLRRLESDLRRIAAATPAPAEAEAAPRPRHSGSWW
jgi:hypothetical protein